MAGPASLPEPTRRSRNSFQCPRCPSSFKRPEHLRRHQKGHENYKQFACSICQKRFTRSDILARHTTTHTRLPEISELSELSGAGKPRRRACNACAKARERCSKTYPCLRCVNRGHVCTYPQAGSLDGSTNNSAEGHLISEEDNSSAYTEGSDGGSASRRTTQLEGIEPGSQHRGLDTTQFAPPNSQIDVSNSVAKLANGPMSGADVFMYPDAMNVHDLDFPMNWLPANDAVDLDFGSFLGLTLPLSNTQMNQLDLPLNNGLATTHIRPGPRHLHDDASSYSRRAASPGTVATLSQNSANPIARMATGGGLYATSIDGARAPCTIRSNGADANISGPNSRALLPITEDPKLSPQSAMSLDQVSRIGFPNIHSVTLENWDNQMCERRLDQHTYNKICGTFSQVCLDSCLVGAAFDSAAFPTITQCNYFINLYFEFFAPIISIVHEPSFDVNDSWVLALAVAAIGCQYSRVEIFWDCVVPMHEFLRRVVLIELSGTLSGPPDITLVQAYVLSQVGMLYCGSMSLQGLAKGRHGELTSLAGSLRLLSPDDMGMCTGVNNISESYSWTLWVEKETKLRLGYTIWLLDCMMVYHFGHEPIMPSNIGQGELPHDGLWSAPDAAKWSVLYQRTVPNPSLITAVQLLFQDKRVKPDLGEFSRIIILHGVYREVFQVREYFGRPLSSWVPSAQQATGGNQPQGLSNGNLGTQVPAPTLTRSWLCGEPTLSSWRNAAMDCVDALHWAANATTALLLGAEHPTVMHLHLARVVLLVPYDEILVLARSVKVAGSSPEGQMHAPSQEQAISAEHEIIQWAQRDEFKARLAAMHSGCFYWHIRRYSTRAFYEPVSIFLATVALWAYSFYTSKVAPQQRQTRTGRSGSASRQVSPQPGGPNDSMQNGESLPTPETAGSTSRPTRMSTYSADPDPTFVRLDRPNDDEMVQLFVRSGRPANMTAYITGVGDIYAPEAPMKILREGRKILGSVAVAWGRSREYLDMLEAMERATADRSGEGGPVPAM